ncbi:bile acid-CoA:amino acid N-acyltransferase-like [Tachysurus vachellii]|uniref:bile acid-CoA:amino acid N-acyltransferase-like n=1 Tax=Tachysurus vachellii TaxID=175792 RepID=UPI00296B3792|nr:bile acid-CoA:amino acid N-acyltransferase-like [Tachysurus vachellii]
MIKQFLRPLLLVRPLRCMVDERFDVRVHGLLPGVRVTLHAQFQSEDGDFWEGFGHYVSNETGNVTVSKDTSLGGSYDGVEPMGLLWSMRPIPGSRTGLRYRKKDVQAQTDLHISVYKGQLTDRFQEKTPIASVVAQRWYMAPGVLRVDVTEKGLKGTLFIPPGPGPFPAVLDLWGGGGGLVEYRSALLASKGYVALSLEYSDQKDAVGKPRTVGIEYFEAAINVLRQHPQVCPERIGILGLSYGAFLSMHMAIFSSVIKPRCIVCISSSHVLPVSGSRVDMSGLIKKMSQKMRYDEEKRQIWRESLKPIPVDTLNKLDMGRIKCPVLLIVGEDDQNCPASESADDMKQMMERAGNSHFLTVLSYPGAGHLIEPPYTPHCRASNFMMAGTGTTVMVLWGGQTKAHSQAQEDSWHKTLAFFEQHLYRNTSN